MDVNIVNQHNLPDMNFSEVWNDVRKQQVYLNAVPTEIQQYAGRIHLNNVQDRLIWKVTEDGTFSSKSFRNQQVSNSSQELEWWKKFWQNWISTTCSCFLWRCLNNAVPVDDLIQKARIPLVSKCICCAVSQTETLDHLLLFSDAAKSVWDLLNGIFDIHFQYQSITQAAAVWIFNSSTKSQYGCLKILAFILAVWEIWNWRNKSIFESADHIDTIKHKVIYRLRQCNSLIIPTRLATWSEQLTIQCLHLQINKPKSRRGRWLKWIPNPEGITVNFHGLIKRNFGVGSFLIRDFSGRVIRWDYRTFTNVTDQFFAHIAILEVAMDMIRSLDEENVEIQSDSKHVIDCLLGKRIPPWRWMDQVDSLGILCSAVSLKLVEPERNWSAITLANKVDQHTAPSLSSSEIRSALIGDSRGVGRWAWL